MYASATKNDRLSPDLTQLKSKVLQRKCDQCEEDDQATQSVLQKKGNVLQLVACQGTTHDTSPEHLAIENEYVARVDNSAREYELPNGSVLTYDNGTHRTGYADLANVGDRTIFDIKRATEAYPEAQLAQYITSANANCGDGWTRGTDYGGPRVIPFSSTENIRAYQDGAGVISYVKEGKGQKSLTSFLKVKTEDPPEEDGYSKDEWLADQQMMDVMERAGMIDRENYGSIWV